MSDINNIYRNIYKDTNRGCHYQGIWHLLLFWKASVFKLIWPDLLMFCASYALLSIIYRHILFDYPKQREAFEVLCIYASRFSNSIPISFLTGFYVSQVVSRWWDQFMSLPWPDKFAMKLVGFVPGEDFFHRHLRRTVMRYINLSTILVYRLVSKKVKDRFPTYQSLVDAKLMLPHELIRLKKIGEQTPHESTWAPILWAVQLLEEARTEGKIKMDPSIFSTLLTSIDYIVESNRKILNYGWVNFPLAYTQVATFSVFFYFLAALFGRQYLVPSKEGMDVRMFPHFNVTFSNTAPFNLHTPDLYVPFFTLVEFLCYMGWIKVAETLLNPFGDDDDDIQVNYIIDRNLQVSYLLVEAAEERLDLTSDPFMEAGMAMPRNLPPYKNRSSKAPHHRLKSMNEKFVGNTPMRHSAMPSFLGRMRDSLARPRMQHARSAGNMRRNVLDAKVTDDDGQAADARAMSKEDESSSEMSGV